MDGQIHHSDCGRANTFNSYFSSIFVDEDLNSVPSFATSSNDHPALSSVEVTPAIVFNKL